ncbi:MAG: hypothetical protein KKA16_09935 [Alphaproteobacteria bacterium]|uniref:DUF5681 domain-containing protein n=1 Tax=viral metagenome TaxID=1070528 RepID=A0A6H1ZJ45_9ZZZZ|nr:hypothetical protein [Alphaproteobacteria bacterium]MBU2377866.1 hypothetical protein [Alphaproteobacteria bacterium]
MTDRDDYAVGYGRPPLASRFAPGTSGNPTGRPKGSGGLKTSLDRILRRKVQLKVDGRRKRVPVTEAVLLQLSHKALGGDAAAIREYLRIAMAHGGEADDAVAIDEAQLTPFVDAYAIATALMDLGVVVLGSDGRMKLRPERLGDAAAETVDGLRRQQLLDDPAVG